MVIFEQLLYFSLVLKTQIDQTSNIQPVRRRREARKDNSNFKAARETSIVCACVCVSVCVCRAPSPSVFVRQRVACEELDMSFRGIRHLKRKEVKATQLGIKHQPTSALSREQLMKTSAREAHRDPLRFILYISIGFIIWHL